METVRLSRQHQKILKMLHDGNSLKKNKQPPWYKNRYALSVKALSSCTNIDFQQEVLSDMGLTPRGKEVFLLILEGLSNRQIAAQLSITPSGVKRHREKMLLRNGCTSMMELVAKYIRLCELHNG